jgi:O-antigen ligase
VRPVALGALSLFLTTPDSRRRVIQLLILLTLPQVAIAAWQTVDARIDFGSDAGRAADSVTGSFGAYGGGPAGLVAAAVLLLAGGLVLAGVLDRRRALGVAVVVVAIEVFTATRAAVVFIPAAAVALVAGVVLVLRRTAPVRTLAVFLGVAALSIPITYAATDAIYPGSFTGAFSNQGADFIGNGIPREGLGDDPLHTPTGEYRGPRGVAVLPGRVTQMKNAARISTEDGARVLLLGRGYGAAQVIDAATVYTYLPKERRVGVTWIGKVLTETGWLGLIAFLGLVGWLAWLGIRILRGPATGYDRALGFALPGFAALTLVGATYTTVLDVRPYSAAFIVLAAAGFAAARDSAAEADVAGGNGRRARPSTPLPPRQHATSTAPSAESARSS